VTHTDEGAKVIIVVPFRNGLIDLETAYDMRVVRLGGDLGFDPII
jgi:hypothetical protein